MRMRFIKYSRKAQLPNNEFHVLEVSVEMREGEDASDAFNWAKEYIHSKMNLKLTATLGELAHKSKEEG